MVRVERDKAFRDPVPFFLIGLPPELLFDLTWTDPALGVQDKSWWPETNEDAPLPSAWFKYGDEILTIDLVRKVVVVTHHIVPLTDEEKVLLVRYTTERVRNAMQDYMDATSREKGYDGLLSLCSDGMNSNAKFAAEARAGLDWRDACWLAAMAIRDQVVANEEQLPTDQEVIDQLPQLVWPE